jgi:hypothetical protein
MDKKIKHLEMLQGVISRMAGNSFLIKGWSITIVSAFVALTVSNGNKILIAAALFPTIMFWFLDAYFLRQERLFRKLYDYARTLDESKIDFSMNTSQFNNVVSPWLGVTVSRTLLIFYGTMLIAGLITLLILA